MDSKLDNQSMGMFLHELKTPLAIIRSHLESELGNEEIPLEVRRKLVMDVEEIARMNHLVSEMRVLMSCENEKVVFEKSSLVGLVMQVIELLEPLADEKHQKIHFKTHENIEIEMNEPKLKQLFYNIIHNAIKYTPTKGDISISIDANEHIVVIIQDSGIGISPEKIGQIYEPFVRAGDERKVEGSGLGLSVAKAIAKLHHAVIAVSSKIGEGTTFKVIFNG